MRHRGSRSELHGSENNRAGFHPQPFITERTRRNSVKIRADDLDSVLHKGLDILVVRALGNDGRRDLARKGHPEFPEPFFQHVDEGVRLILHEGLLREVELVVIQDLKRIC